jgi:transposase
MIKINFTEQEKAALHHERFHHPHPRVQLKMEVLYLKSQGLAHKEITRLTGINEETLRTYIGQYLEGGIERLKEINFYRPTTKLVEYKDSIENYFRENPPATINEAIAKIEELTGIRRSPTQVRKFLKSLGMKPRKVGMIPSKADSEEQEAFKKKN